MEDINNLIINKQYDKVIKIFANSNDFTEISSLFRRIEFGKDETLIQQCKEFFTIENLRKIVKKIEERKDNYYNGKLQIFFNKIIDYIQKEEDLIGCKDIFIDLCTENFDKLNIIQKIYIAQFDRTKKQNLINYYKANLFKIKTYDEMNFCISNLMSFNESGREYIFNICINNINKEDLLIEYRKNFIIHCFNWILYLSQEQKIKFIEQCINGSNLKKFKQNENFHNYLFRKLYNLFEENELNLEQKQFFIEYYCKNFELLNSDKQKDFIDLCFKNLEDERIITVKLRINFIQKSVEVFKELTDEQKNIVINKYLTYNDYNILDLFNKDEAIEYIYKCVDRMEFTKKFLDYLNENQNLEIKKQDCFINYCLDNFNNLDKNKQGYFVQHIVNNKIKLSKEQQEKFVQNCLNNFNNLDKHEQGYFVQYIVNNKIKLSEEQQEKIVQNCLNNFNNLDKHEQGYFIQYIVNNKIKLSEEQKESFIQNCMNNLYNLNKDTQKTIIKYYIATIKNKNLQQYFNELLKINIESCCRNIQNYYLCEYLQNIEINKRNSEDTNKSFIYLSDKQYKDKYKLFEHLLQNNLVSFKEKEVPYIFFNKKNNEYQNDIPEDTKNINDFVLIPNFEVKKNIYFYHQSESKTINCLIKYLKKIYEDKITIDKEIYTGTMQKTIMTIPSEKPQKKQLKETRFDLKKPMKEQTLSCSSANSTESETSEEFSKNLSDALSEMSEQNKSISY